MEEKKNARPAIVGKQAKGAHENRKPTYEELNNYCMQLLNQNKALVEQLKQRDLAMLFKRMDYLFAVVGNSGMFPKEFVDKCVGDIQAQLTVPEDAGEGESDGEAAEA